MFAGQESHEPSYVARNAVFQAIRWFTGPGQGVRVILLYHSISKGMTTNSYSLPASSFVRQMEFLSAHFKVVRLRDLAKAMEAEMPHVNLAVVTFDDGCLDNYEVALPILERFGIKATFFIVTGYVGRRLPTFAGKIPIMEKSHIRELSELGHEFGAHTVNHLKLTKLPLDQVREELEGSKQTLEDWLGHEVVSLAYPKGDHNEKVKQEALKSGFRFAVTIEEGLVPQQPDWLALPRVWISRWLNFPAFTAKVSPAVEVYKRLRGR